MTREQQRKLRELKSNLSKILKEKSKKYNLKKRDYMLWFQKGDMFFTCLLYVGFSMDGKFVCDTIENMKPLWIDDLLWDFLKSPENKKQPLSLRAIGAFTVHGVDLYRSRDELINGELSELEICVEKYIEHFYQTIQSVKPDVFYQNISSSPYHEELRISLTFIHEKKYKEALEYLCDKDSGVFHSGDISIHNAIREFCEKQINSV